MKQQARHQLALDLMYPQRFQPLARRPEGLLEALADLLMEALAEPDPQNLTSAGQSGTKGTGDEPKDHA
ncbi:MAG: hypothetical protein ACE5EU_11935 [Paracoccaceae bacterium]